MTISSAVLHRHPVTSHAITVPADNDALLHGIEVRRSVRTYDSAPLGAEHLAVIRAYLQDPVCMAGPLGTRFRIELLTDVDEDKEIGTYGYTKGFRTVLVAIARPEPLALFELAYVLHGLVLHLAHLGVGTVWMGAAFNPADILESTHVRDDEIIAAIVPLGYAGSKKRLIDYAAPLVLKASKRKSMDEVFFFGDFETPLGADGGPFHRALDIARRAPSAKNKQSWRAVVSPDHTRIHLYAAFSLRKEVGTGRKQYACPPEYLDVGTFYRSLEVALAGDGLAGSLVVDEPEVRIPAGADVEYLATWVGR